MRLFARSFTHLLSCTRLMAAMVVFVTTVPCAALSANAQAAAELASIVVATSPADAGFIAEARVEAVRAATIAAQVPGRVLDIRVEPGQKVARGQVLMTLDARELAGADAAGQAQLAQARAAWERSQQLHRQKFISQSALDQAELAYKAALGNAGASGASLSHASVTAPMAGVIGERLIEVGELASPGRPVLTVFDPAALRVIAEVPQSRLTALRGKNEQGADKGASAIKARVELVESGRQIAVTRVEVLPTVDRQSHTVTVRLYLAAVDGLAPGMAVRARLITGLSEKMTVPAEAIVRRGEVTAVYVLPAEVNGPYRQPRLRQVRLGERQSDGRIEVLAGLAAGERIATDAVKAGIAQKNGQ